MSANAELICDDIRYWMSRIRIADGYSTTVQQVFGEWRTFDDVRASGLLPAICVFPTKSSPPPVYEVGGYEDFVDVTIVGFVDGNDDVQRAFDLRAFEDDIHQVLRVDQYRDRWAVSTVKHVGQLTDLGDPGKGGVHLDVNTLVTGVRCSYYPHESAEQRMAFAEINNNPAAATVIGAPGTYVIAAGTWAPPLLVPVEFTQPTAGQPVMRYTGKKTKLFEVRASVNPTAAAGQPTVAIATRTSAAAAWVIAAHTARVGIAGATEHMAVQGIFELAEGAEVSLQVTNGSTTDAVTLNGSVSIVQIPRF